MEKLEFESNKNQSVFDAIKERKKTLNFSMLKTVLRKKDIKVNGKKIDKDMQIKPGDLITVYLKEKKQKANTNCLSR